MHTQIGFIGQGWIGKNYADDFEARGHSVVRYALEEPYVHNKEKIKECELVFIAVPTPTTPEGFDDSYVRSAIEITSPGTAIVIKSTIIPGTTNTLQEAFLDRIIMHSPEFLREAHAANDAAHPNRNIIGIAIDSPEHHLAAEKAMSVLPEAPYMRIMPARAAELVKYAGNCFLHMKVVYANLLYDLTQHMNADYDAVAEAMGHDPRIGHSHLLVVHPSRPGESAKRGSGGHCFIKDFAAFRKMYESAFPEDHEGIAAWKGIEYKNVALLKQSGKDLDILTGVYGDTI